MAGDTGILTEHEARNVDAPVGTYNEPPKEFKARKLVDKVYFRNKEHRSKYDYRWLDYYKFFRGKQWLKARPGYRHSEVINMIFQTIQSQVPVMTDARPRVTYLPRDPSDFEFAEIMNDLWTSDSDAGNWLFATTEVVYDSHIYGWGLSSMHWNPEANFGMGAIEYKCEDPFYQFPDPDARDTNVECESWVTVEPIFTPKLRNKYPEKARFIRSDAQDVADMHRTQLGAERFRSPVNNRAVLEQEYGEPEFAGDKSFEITAYLKPGEMTEEKSKDNEGNDVFVQKKKFPHGRTIKIAGGIVVEDEPSLPYIDDEIPYNRLVNYILPREFYGISEIEPLESPQVIFNTLVSYALDVLTLMGNPIWVVDTSANIDVETIFNRPGLILEKEEGSEVRREAGVQLQPYVLQMIDRIRDWFDQIAGTQDVTRGVKPGSVTAAKAIEALLTASAPRFKQKMRNLDAYMQGVGTQYHARVLEYYTQARVFRITNKDGSMKFFRFRVTPEMSDDGKPTGKKVAEVTDINQDPVTGKYMEGETRKMYAATKLDVRVATGSGLPFAKAEQEDRLINYFDRGIVDREEVLKATDYPNAEKVLARVAEQEQAQAQAEAEAAAAGQPA